MKSTKRFEVQLSKLYLVRLGIDGPDMPRFEGIASRLEIEKPKVGGSAPFLLLIHGTVAHKVSAASYRLNNMKALYPSIFAASKSEDPLLGEPFFKFSVELESFFTSAYGALQAFANEVSAILGLAIDSKQLYFHTIVDKAVSDYPKLKLAQTLSACKESDWFKYLNLTRNRIEHGAIPLYHVLDQRQLILADRQWPIETVASYDGKLEVIGHTSHLLSEGAALIESASVELETLLF